MSRHDDKELALIEKISREFSVKALLPNRVNNDQYPFGDYPMDVLEKAFDLGFFHILLPEEMEGMGRRLGPLCVLLQAVCETDAGMGAVLLTNAFAQEILFASQDDKSLKAISSVKGGVSDFLTGFQIFDNPSDAVKMPTATKTEGGYRLSGTAEYVVLGGLAKRCLLPARIEGRPSYSYFLVDTETDSVRKSGPILSLGLHMCPAVDLTLDNSEAMLTGEADKGEIYFSGACQRLFCAMAAMILGVMQGSFKAALDYSRKRPQGGKKIIGWTEVQMMTANMAVRLKAAELMAAAAWRAADEKAKGWEQAAEAAAIFLMELVPDFTSDGIQIFGGYGYIKEYGQEKHFRDAKQLQCLAGIFPMKKIRYLRRHFNLSA
jgi:alkylation response protein AidB-like acyl-CoA dehydrogenase